MVTIEKSNVRSMEYRAVGALVPHLNNPRTHSPKQLKQIEGVCPTNVAWLAHRW